VSVLVDTSVWVDYLRGEDTRATRGLRDVLRRPDSVCMTEPVAMELLAGATDEMMLGRLEKLTTGLPSLGVDQALDFRAAAAIYRGCRQAGRTVRNLSNCLIAAVAIRHGVAVLHKDADYESIAAVSPLEEESLR
jgi:predicted nucleic acid-binding protein